MSKTEKPVLLPSAISASFLLWSCVFALYFVAVLVCYLQWNRLREARVAAVQPKSSAVATSYFSLTTPAGWQLVSLTNDTAILRRTKGEALPAILIAAERDSDFRYRALDANPALFAQMIDRVLEKEPYMPPNTVPQIDSVWTLDVRPGVHAVHGHFALGDVRGYARYFYVGDIRYFCCTTWKFQPGGSVRAYREKLDRFWRGVEFSCGEEAFDRPEVDSSRLGADEHARICRTMRRELALGRLHAARVKSEPAGNLLPAIQHFRLGLEAASSVREERLLTESPEFTTYLELLAQRRAAVREWFVILDKFRATGDLNGALKQAAFIAAHATLKEEAEMRSRAQRMSRELSAQLQTTAAQK